MLITIRLSFAATVAFANSYRVMYFCFSCQIWENQTITGTIKPSKIAILYHQLIPHILFINVHTIILHFQFMHLFVGAPLCHCYVGAPFMSSKISSPLCLQKVMLPYLILWFKFNQVTMSPCLLILYSMICLEGVLIFTSQQIVSVYRLVIQCTICCTPALNCTFLAIAFTICTFVL